jgi:hypothetical protein
VSEITNYISYFITQQGKAGQPNTPISSEDENIQPIFNSSEEDVGLVQQKKVIHDFLQNNGQTAEVLDTFIEIPENRRTQKWPQLLKAIHACQEKGATLLIAELGTLTGNEAFTKALLTSGVQFYCCDQPFVNQTILEALHKHAQVQKKLHGKLIREGLKMTSAKSGNPNAAEVINKVNKPKIDTAIVFAFLLQPIITDYRKKGYSQRQMVKSLNEEGFTAPEGGKWVLSQLQKVLDRVKLNEIALELQPIVQECLDKGCTPEEITEELNNRNIAPIKRSEWDINQVKKLTDRIEQIQEITWMNQFIIDFLPILHTLKKEGLSAQEMLSQLEQTGIPIKSTPEHSAA